MPKYGISPHAWVRSRTQIMNLDLLPLGWVHFIASMVALAVGAWLWCGQKVRLSINCAAGFMWWRFWSPVSQRLAFFGLGFSSLPLVRGGSPDCDSSRYHCSRLQDTAGRLDPSAPDVHVSEPLYLDWWRSE